MSSPAPTPDQERYQAEFFDGWSLAEKLVYVTIEGTRLRIFDPSGRELASWEAAGVQCDAMQDGGVVHVTHADFAHETLVVRDARLEQRILGLRPRVEALPGGNRKLGLAFAWLGALVVVACGAYLAIPRLARAVAQRVPLEHERALGMQMEALLDMSGCSESPAHGTLRGMVRELAGTTYEVRIVEGSAPNAFALPGGVILVTDALLEQAESSDEVAGVLAHEIEHIAQRHVLSGFLRDAVLTGLWSVTLGDYAGLMVVDPSTAYRIANLEFSREDEAAADRAAVQRLHRAGVSHRGLTAFFQRLQARYGDHAPEWLSTHPDTPRRIAALSALPDVQAPHPALGPDAFAALKGACAAH